MDQPESESIYYNFNLDLHNVVERPGNPTLYNCSICSCGYKYEYSLKRHVLRSHVNRAYITSSDRTTFGVIVDGHHRRTPSGQTFSCNACHRLYADRTELINHIRMMHYVSIVQTDTKDVLIITCPSCKAEFCNMRSLNCHMRSHKRASWNSNGKDSLSSNKPSQSFSEADSTIAQKHFIPSTTTSTQPNNINQSLPSPSASSSKTRRKKKQPVMTNIVSKAETARDNERDVAAVSPVEPTGACSDDMPGHSGDEVQDSNKKRQLRQRTSNQRSSLFSCTICHRTFHSYSNMLRHRKLSHELLIKKGPELSHVKNKRRTKKRSRFCDSKVARRYFNKVAGDVAFNMKNCVHGNSEHVNSSQHYIQKECKTNLAQLRSGNISKRLQQQCNIRIKPVKNVMKTTVPRRSESSARTVQPTETIDQTQKQFSLDSTSPDVYDRPGLWKFLCLVCMQYFPNTLELFIHQDSTHKRVNTTYMEVGKNFNLPLHAVATSKSRGCLPVTDGHSVICNPAKYTCTKCQQQFKTPDDLHPHLIVCGKELLLPLTIQILPPPASPNDTSNTDYGKVKGNKKGRWQRGNDADGKSQQKITDMNGFHVRKKKKRSRLESEVEEQKRLEEKLKLIDDLSPRSFQPSLEPLVTLKDITDYNAAYREQPSSKTSHAKSSCPYCGIIFKYKKVLQRHINKCEMMKRIISPDEIDGSTDTDVGVVSIKSNNDAEVVENKVGASGMKRVTTLSTFNQDVKSEAGSVGTNALSTPEKLAKSSLVSDDLFSPSRSLVQARALAKFIHPARTCGPCFTCKKPNMARRYIHLQQRSNSFVQFVTSKCKSVSLQSCICKACELRFNRDYANRKSRLEKYSINRKSPSQTRSLARKSPLTPRRLSDLTLQRSNRKKPSTTRQKTTVSISNSKRNSNGQASRSARKATPESTDREIRTNQAITRNTMSSVRRKQFKPVQTKSLEQIFPEDFDTDEELPLASHIIMPSHQPITKILPVNRPEFFHPIEVDIIDVEKEIKTHKLDRQRPVKNTNIRNNREKAKDIVSRILGGDGLFDNATAKIVRELQPLRLPKEEVNNGIDLPKDGRVLEPINAEESSDARLKVIMQFVKDSPIRTRSKIGRKSSLTDIIDAVTQKVKEDPRLAVTLTEAINAATAGLDQKDCKRPTRLTAARETAAVRQSVSLPSVLDGLVVKFKTTPIGKPEFSEIKISSVSSDKNGLRQPCAQPTAPSTLIGDNLVNYKYGHQKQPSNSLPPTVPSQVPYSTAMDVSPVYPPQVLLCPPIVNTLLSSFPPIKPTTITPATTFTTSSADQSQLPTRNWSIIDGQPKSSAQNIHVDGTDLILAPFRMAKATKRRHSDVSSVGSLGSSCPPKKKFVMTESSYNHMVEIIDAVARGEISAASRFCTDDDHYSVTSETDSERSRQIYDFMMESRDSLECIRTADQALRRSASPQPMKNLRLASIINKLSATNQKGECKNDVPIASPTSSQNPNSIDSGFISLVG